MNIYPHPPKPEQQQGQGLLSALGGGVLDILKAGTGYTAAKRARDIEDQERKAKYLTAGINPYELNNPEYAQEFLARANEPQEPTSNTEWAYNIAEARKAGVSEDVITKLVQDRLNTQAKGFDTLQGQAGATQRGKSLVQQEFEPVTAGLKEQAVQDVRTATAPIQKQNEYNVMLKNEPVLREATKTAELQATDTANASEALKKARTDLSGLEEGIARLKTDLQKTPNLVGLLSKPQAKLSELTYGKAGFTPEQMETRGRITNQVSIAGFQMLKFATENGLSGINTVSEAKRAIGKLTADSTAEEITGAADALLLARRDMVKAMEARAGIQEEVNFDDLWSD